ncbi:hypothetical protein V502_06046 [Pseudogymnoascus sp. VKM F-4520 (FW-2644)]|nr:hypothetical protein V502_06046 [Pseudogymnoascus sp. VKM F-4520 (FW-2644)]
MEAIFKIFRDAHIGGNGYQLSDTLLPISPSEEPGRLRNFFNSTNAANVKGDIQYNVLYDRQSTLRLSTEEGKAWVDVYTAYWAAAGEIIKAEDAQKTNSPINWVAVYETWKEMTNAIIRGYSTGCFEAWTIPCLYTSGKYLRIFAIKADAAGGNADKAMDFQDDFNPDTGKNEKLEDAARVLNRMFQLCVSDRAPLEESRKWGIYNIVNLLFKTYFKLNSVALSKNIIRALQASRGDIPDVESFPKSHQAETFLTQAWELCHKQSTRNKELILTYLIPCHLLTTHTLPTETLLAPYPRLQKLFLPLSRCIKRGDLTGFDNALAAGENEFVKRRIYLTLERGRDIALRNLLRKVFIAGGFEEPNDKSSVPVRRTRVTVAEFGAAISIGNKEKLDDDEVECLLANIIYKNLMKGYIARERGIVVLSKGGAFPGTGI